MYINIIFYHIPLHEGNSCAGATLGEVGNSNGSDFTVLTCKSSFVECLCCLRKTRNMIVPATIVTAATALIAIPTIAAPANPLLLSVEGVPVVVAATAIPVPVLVSVLVSVSVLVIVFDTTLAGVSTTVPVLNREPLWLEMLHILVENTDGVEFGVIVPMDLLGSTLYCFDAATVGVTFEFGESHRGLQTLM
jgi:hypothetical protein